jgi:hypothetical protein
MSEDKLPDEIDREMLDELAKKLLPMQFYYLQEALNEGKRTQLREEISDQVPELADILRQMTELEYFEQEIEIESVGTLTFRTIPSWAPEDAEKFAAENSDQKTSRNRIYSRRRLAHALIKIGDRPLGGVAVQGSYADHKPDELRERLESQIEARYQALSSKPDMLVAKLSEIFSAWDVMVWDRLEAQKPDSVKN